MKNKITPVFIFVFIFVFYGILKAEQYDDTWTTNTVTHIEYNAFGLIKIEMPAMPSKEALFNKDSKEDKKQPKTERTFFAPLPIGVEHINNPPYDITNVSVLKIPFWETVDYNSIFKKEFNFEKDTNPMKKSWVIDKPLFSFIHGFTIKDNSPEENNKERWPIRVKRARLIDTLVFSFLKYDEWGNKEWGEGNNYHLELCDVLGYEVYNRERGINNNKWHFLDIPFFDGFKKHKKYSKSDTEILSVFIAGSVFKRQHDKGQSDKWKLLDLPLVWLMKFSEESDEKSEFGFLETEGFHKNFLGFSLFSYKSEDGKKSNKFLTIPILGPMFSTLTSKDESVGAIMFFPRIFNWKAPWIAK